MKKFPTLYGIASNNKIKEWTISVEELEDDLVITKTLNGYIDGKKAESNRETLVGKNIGKKNETTPYEQAVFEADKKWRNKKEKQGYTESIDSIKQNSFEEPILPMLAKKYDINSKSKKKKDINFPCYCQPKLDGLRCMALIQEGNVVLMSRVGKFFINLNHIKKSLNKFLLNNSSIVLDGELYSNIIPFEEITGICRSEKKVDLTKEKYINYHIYDLYDKKNKDITYDKRFNILEENLSNIKHIQIILNELIQSKNDIKKFHDKYISEGFEGIMLRNINSIYTLKNRSSDLQKYKEFLDDEFKIIGFHESSGEDKGTIIWECEYTNNNNEKASFSIKPKGAREFRRKLFEEASVDFKKFRGKFLTVRFQELSENNCPRFPVGIDVRYDI